MTWTNIQQLLIERYLPLVESNVSNVVNYSIDLFYRYIAYQTMLYWSWLSFFVILDIVILITMKKILRANKVSEDDSCITKSDKEDIKSTTIVASIFLILCSIVFIACMLSSLLWYYFVPEIQVYKSLTQ